MKSTFFAGQFATLHRHVPAQLCRIALIALLVWIPGSGHAQSTGLTLGEGTQPTESSSQTLDLGPADKEPVTQPAAAPSQEVATGSVRNDQNLVRTTYGSWEVACAKTGSPCVMAQIGTDEKGTPMLEMVLRKLPEPQTVQGVPVIAVTDIITPLGVVLTSGVTMKIDTANEQRAPYQICTEQGCLVREPLTEEAVTRFKKGNKTRLTIVAAQQGPIEVDLSLAGFTKAYAALK